MGYGDVGSPGVGGSACGMGTGMGLGLWSEIATAGPAFQITLAE